jgi:flagellar hook-length control protein FliK
MTMPDLNRFGVLPKVPGANGLAHAAATSNAGGVAGARPVASGDFATDLARLVALLGTGGADAAPPMATADAEEDPATLAEPGDDVEALCAEVALALPAVLPPGTDPGPSDDGHSADPALPGVAGESREPAKTVRALLTPPGSDVAAGNRSGDAPTLPTLPLLPSAASGAAAFTLAPDATPETVAPGGTPASTPTDASTVVATAATVVPDIAARPAPAPHTIAATVVDTLQPQAPRQIAETVTWHVPAQGAAEVRIRLNPEELGPVDVQLKLDGDKVSVRFDLADERVRDVVQSSLPSLSAMLSSRGLQLDQAQVFSQQRSPHQQQAAPQGAWSSARHETSDEGSSTTIAGTRPLMRRGLLDDYA